MRTSEEALALREKRNKAIKDMYNELNRQQTLTQAQIYHRLSERFYLLERQLAYIINGK